MHYSFSLAIGFPVPGAEPDVVESKFVSEVLELVCLDVCFVVRFHGP